MYYIFHLKLYVANLFLILLNELVSLSFKMSGWCHDCISNEDILC